MQKLIRGQNLVLKDEAATINIISGAQADFSAFILYGDGKIRADEDFIFYGQLANPAGSLRLSQGPEKAQFSAQLQDLPADVSKIVFVATSDFSSISQLGALELTLAQIGADMITCEVDLKGRQEAALIIGEIYRYKNNWKFRFVDQGFKGGLKPLAENFGVEIAEEVQETSPTRHDVKKDSGQRPINLSKVTLTKAKPTIDLSKHNLSRDLYRVNLNWNQTPAKRGSRLGSFLGRSKDAVDLDLAAYVRLKNGQQTIIQALGNTFGDLEHFPYIKLLGDDRTGEQKDGEWLEINGAKLDEIAEIIIFTFIYDGVPNWSATDAKVRLMIAGQPEIETTLTEGDNNLPMCAIARIINEGGNLRIERLNRYYPGHRQMDADFGWNFEWQRARKD